MSEERPADPAPAGRDRRVIVAGYGPVGRVVVEMLEAEDAHVTILDMNPQTVGRHQDRRRILHGDVTEPAALEEAGIRTADALILAIPDERQAVEACAVARRMSPRIFIAARTNFVSRGLLATQAGADCVVIEEVVTAEAMERAVIQNFLRRPD